MWAVWLLFLLMWMGFLWTPKPTQTHAKIQVQEPTFQQNCCTKKIHCVDDCSFLCVENSVKCIGGVCVPDSHAPIECNTERGGRLMLTNDPVPKWICLCTDETFWSGPACDTLNPDVCEHGAFLYNGRDDFLCLCLEPYKKVIVNGKPHCLENYMVNFFHEDLQVVKQNIGPSR